MSEKEPQFIDQLTHLFLLSMEGTMSNDQFSTLTHTLKTNPVARDYYYDFIASYVGLEQLGILSETNEAQEGEYLQQFWMGLLEHEKTAPEIQIHEEKPSRELIQKVIYPSKEKRTTSKYQIFTLVMGAAAVIFLVLFLRLVPVKQYSTEVATLADQMNVAWADSKMYFQNGDRLWTNQRPVGLEKGILKIQYDTGVEVLIEGPAKFVIERSGLYFEYGRLFSRVSESGVGFFVETPAARFVDLGTEFGVQVNIDGTSEVHVMNGKISAISGTGSNEIKSQVVHEGYARRIENSKAAWEIPIAQNAFVQDIDSQTKYIWRGQPINLADVLGGGNGWGTGQLNIRIDPRTGQLSHVIDPAPISRETPYVRVPLLDFVDGVFIPDGEKGPIQVSSDGDLFDGCPDTVGRCFYGPFNGSILPLRTAQNEIVDHPVQLGGQRYGTPDHPIIHLHSNLGITFDLHKIRRSLPKDIRIDRFSAFCAVGERPEDSKTLHDYVDFFVLVDGQERFRATDMEYRSEQRPIDLPLTEKDRFLTLITTEGRDKSINLDWGIFAEPQLKLTKTDPNQAPSI